MAYVANVKVLPQNALSLSGSRLELTGSTSIDGHLTVDGEITAQKLIIEETINTVVYSSGSVKLGDAPGGAQEDKHQISGSVYMSGSEAVFTLPNAASYLQVVGGHFKGDGRGLTKLSSSNLVHTDTGAKLLISKDDGTFNLAALQGGSGVSFDNSSANGTVKIEISAEQIGAVTKISGSNGIAAYDWTGSLTGPNGIENSGSLRLVGQAAALHNLDTSGLIARTGAGTVDARTIKVSNGSSVLSVTNGDGILGDPTLSLTSASANTAGALVVRDANGDFAANEITVTSLSASSLTGTLDVSSATGNQLAGATEAGQLLIGHATNGTFQVTLPTANATAGASGNDNIVLGLGDGTLDVSLSKNLKGLTSVSASYLTASVAVKAAQLTASSGLITTVNAQLVSVSGGSATVTGSAMTVDGQYLSGSGVLVREKFQNNGAMYLKIRTLTSSSSGPVAVAADDYMLSCNAAADAFTITLPNANTSGMQGRTFVVKKSDITSKAVTVSSNNIDGGTLFLLNGPYQAVNFTSDGGKWLVH